MKAYRLLLLAALLGLAACQTTPKRPSEAPTPQAEAFAPELEKAAERLAAADYTAAAAIYSNLAARAEPPARYEFYLRAADALARADLSRQARQLLAAVPTEQLDPSLQLRARLVEARVLLRERRPEEVLSLLDGTPPADAGPELLATFHGLRADAYTMQGNRLETARELVQREPFLSRPEAVRDNQFAIWRTLDRLSGDALQQLSTAPPPDVLSGWMQLVRIVKLYQVHPKQLREHLQQWRDTYSEHPVLPEILDALLGRDQQQVAYPKRIALLLPLSGRFAPAAQALRDGFLAAYYTQPREGGQLVRVYDVGENPLDVLSVYRRAVEDGADFVVGPLDKEAVDALARQPQLPVPTLALNYSNLDTAPPQLYQFGLSPEDEARQVAERTWLDGHVYAAALYPDSDWGKRVFSAFRDRWLQLGGKVVEQQTYDQQRNDFSNPIQRLLNIDESQNRYRHLRRIIGEDIKFVPRRRQDLDFIFVAARPRQARLLRPQLRFFHAAGVPVYSTSHVYTGELDKYMDRDMNGLTFGDMPWVVPGKGESPLRKRLTPLISAPGRNLERLYALGIDAFDVIAALKPLQQYPFERYPGQTGSLSLDDSRRVHRQLTWMRFIGGEPVRLDHGSE